MSDTEVLVVEEMQTTIVVEGSNDMLVVEEATTDVIEMGIAGPQGPPGDFGAVDFVQSTPASEWIINHNRGHKPVVSVMSMGGAEILATVLHTSDNQTRVYFETPPAGFARLV